MAKNLKWIKNGKEYLLSRRPYEAALSPVQDNDGWYWWIRTPSSRFSGKSDTSDGAKATVAMIVHWTERGEDPAFHLSDD